MPNVQRRVNLRADRRIDLRVGPAAWGRLEGSPRAGVMASFSYIFGTERHLKIVDLTHSIAGPYCTIFQAGDIDDRAQLEGFEYACSSSTKMEEIAKNIPCIFLI